MKTCSIKLSDIVTTAGTQIRARIDNDSVDDYAAAMVDGAKFPPVVVFHDGSEYILADGFHRVMAASRNGFTDILAEIHKGAKSDALKFALAANAAHGLKRTNADKRRSVELALAEWPKLSTAEIARICAVSRPQVDSVRREQHAESACSEEHETRIGADGKERQMPKKTESSLPAAGSDAPKSTTPNEETGGQESQDAPPPRPVDDEWKAALGAPTAEPPVTEYYTRLERLVDDALENATDKQLVSMSVFASKVCHIIKTELREREQRRKKEKAA